MATKTKNWANGPGAVTIEYNGSGNGQITISSDSNNLYEARSMQIVVQTTAGSPQQTRTVTITQAAKVRTPNFILSDGKYLLLSDDKYFNVRE